VQPRDGCRLRAHRRVITDPRDLGASYPKVEEPARMAVNTMMFVPPIDAAEARQTPLEKTSNITTLPDFGPFGDITPCQPADRCPRRRRRDQLVARKSDTGRRQFPRWS
jgi:hypothetical protein